LLVLGARAGSFGAALEGMDYLVVVVVRGPDPSFSPMLLLSFVIDIFVCLESFSFPFRLGEAILSNLTRCCTDDRIAHHFEPSSLLLIVDLFGFT
jgi:hypothetical protein